jgi:hypothetical protein
MNWSSSFAHVSVVAALMADLRHALPHENPPWHLDDSDPRQVLLKSVPCNLEVSVEDRCGKSTYRNGQKPSRLLGMS